MSILDWLRRRLAPPASHAETEAEPETMPSASESVQNDYSKASALQPKAVLFALGALAAVGTALIAGVSLTDMAELKAADRDDALVAAAVGLGAVFAAIFVAFLSQIKIDRPLDELRRNKSVRRRLSELQVLSGLYPSVDELAAKYQTVQVEWAEAWRRHLDDINGAASGKALVAAERRMAQLEDPINTVLESGNFFLVRRRSLRFGYALFALALIAGGSLLFFVSKVSDSDASRLTPIEQPAAVKIRLLGAGLEKLQALSGTGCQAATIEGLLLSANGAISEVVTLATSACPPARLVLDSQDGVVVGP